MSHAPVLGQATVDTMDPISRRRPGVESVLMRALAYILVAWAILIIMGVGTWLSIWLMLKVM